jgi:hypothetical protein
MTPSLRHGETEVSGCQQRAGGCGREVSVAHRLRVPQQHREDAREPVRLDKADRGVRRAGEHLGDGAGVENDAAQDGLAGLLAASGPRARAAV